MHLKPEELVDLAEGARAESEAPHLAACGECRAQLADLRATLSAAADIEVPEPSPLFWDHLSRRVHDAVAAEAEPSRGWPAALRRGLLARASLEPLAAIGVVVLAIYATMQFLAPVDPRPVGSIDAPLAREFLSDSPIENDASLSLVATLAANVDTAEGAALANPGSAEHAVTHMNDDELRELRRILQRELMP